MAKVPYYVRWNIPANQGEWVYNIGTLILFAPDRGTRWTGGRTQVVYPALEVGTPLHIEAIACWTLGSSPSLIRSVPLAMDFLVGATKTVTAKPSVTKTFGENNSITIQWRALDPQPDNYLLQISGSDFSHGSWSADAPEVRPDTNYYDVMLPGNVTSFTKRVSPSFLKIHVEVFAETDGFIEFVESQDLEYPVAPNTTTLTVGPYGMANRAVLQNFLPPLCYESALPGTYLKWTTVDANGTFGLSEIVPNVSGGFEVADINAIGEACLDDVCANPAGVITGGYYASFYVEREIELGQPDIYNVSSVVGGVTQFSGSGYIDTWIDNAVGPGRIFLSYLPQP